MVVGGLGASCSRSQSLIVLVCEFLVEYTLLRYIGWTPPPPPPRIHKVEFGATTYHFSDVKSTQILRQIWEDLFSRSHSMLPGWPLTAGRVIQEQIPKLTDTEREMRGGGGTSARYRATGFLGSVISSDWKCWLT